MKNNFRKLEVNKRDLRKMFEQSIPILQRGINKKENELNKLKMNLENIRKAIKTNFK